MALIVLIICAALFVATHVGLSALPVKAALERNLGAGGAKGLYALVSLLTFGGMIVAYAFFGARGAALWAPLGWDNAFVWILMILAFLFIAYSVATPSPVGADMGRPVKPEARGMLRVTSHPQNMGMLCFGLAHVLVTGTVGGLALYGSFVVLPLIGSWHETAKTRRSEAPAVQVFLKETSPLPFGAILAGRNRLVLGEFALPTLLGAIVAGGAAVGLHFLL
ncbi:MAG TPA: NnrU family protein [Rectinemataceae bacterium]|nr:NnrU family protein [Rectinemataceae bacterium]